MNNLLILLPNRAERYLVGTDLIRCWIDPSETPDGLTHTVFLELEDGIIRIKAGQYRDVYNRVCESYLNHPGVIDLRGLNVSLDDVEEE